MMKKCDSPCNTCTRVQNPDLCENKHCKDWKAWFLQRWHNIYRYGKLYNPAGKEKRNELAK